MPLNNVLVFVSNTTIVNNYVEVNYSYGDGPVRLLVKDGSVDVVLVDGSDIVSTLFRIPDTTMSTEEDRTTPLFNITDNR